MPSPPPLPSAPGSQTASSTGMLPGSSNSNSLLAGVPQDILALASMADPDQGIKIIADYRASQGDALKTVGGMMWDPTAQTYKPIPGYTEQAAAIAAAGRPPQQPQQPSPFGSWYAAFKAENQRPPNAKEIARWNNENSGGGITPAQTANNAEIDAARSYVEQSGLSREEILRRTQSADNLGLENPEYDPYLASAVKLGFQRKIGDDPQFGAFQQRYRGGSTAVPTTTTPPPTGGGTTTPGGALDLPRSSSGEVDSSQLKVNKTYSIPNPDGSVSKWRWTGTDFIEAP
jgi:hypothetical protein